MYIAGVYAATWRYFSYFSDCTHFCSGKFLDRIFVVYDGIVGETTVTEQLLLDTMSLCADANTRLRIKLCQSYIRKKEIAIECSRLSPDDQKRLKKQVSGRYELI